MAQPLAGLVVPIHCRLQLLASVSQSVRCRWGQWQEQRRQQQSEAGARWGGQSVAGGVWVSPVAAESQRSAKRALPKRGLPAGPRALSVSQTGRWNSCN